MIEITVQEAISYIANIVFVTWGIVAIANQRHRKKENANFFSAAYEMGERLTSSLTNKNDRAQAEGLVSFLKATTRNHTGRSFDIVGEEIRDPFLQGQPNNKLNKQSKKYGSPKDNR